MQCPKSKGEKVVKNGHRYGKQCYQRKQCKHQFVEFYSKRGYSEDVRQICLRMYCNGMGFIAIERCTGIGHNTVIGWVKKTGVKLPESEEIEEVPEVGELDELQTFVGSKENKVWVWTAVNHFAEGILAWTIGDRSSETFAVLWAMIRSWSCYFWVSDGCCVYPKFINPEDHIVSKAYMTRVGENTRLRHYLARLHRRTLCYSKSKEMLQISIQLLLFYLNRKNQKSFPI
ncbi:MAG: IS1 family transposase, partial [Pseudanabaena sp. M046S1SP1A06QC]|nr:IS1 family transposase [Pseudanabaena sp. M046S1SP1A06QC]